MGNRFVFGFIVLLCACASPKLLRDRVVDPELWPYLAELEDYYGISTSINLRFADLDGTIVGQCQVRRNVRTIFIDRPWYDEYATRDNVDELMLHEFGHCAFSRPHHGEYFMDGEMRGCLSSVMHPTLVISNTPCWRKFKTYYREEIRH